MKKIYSLMLLSVMSILVLFGCGKDKSIENVESAYTEMVNSFVVSEENKFFSDYNNPNSIVITYPATVDYTIKNASPSNAVQKRYRGLYYQQLVLNNIFDYYDHHQQDFYRIAKGKDIDNDEINDLYDSIVELKDNLKDFESHYTSFLDATENGISDIMEFNITSYSYYLNKVIDKSFDFIYKFHDMYVDYCIDDYSAYNETNLNIYVDKAYLDISYVVYLENIKSFNYSVGSHGVCDLADVVGSQSEYNLLELLENKKSISDTIIGNVGATTEQGVTATNTVNLFVYSKDVFEQRLNTYISTYYDSNIFQINQYKYDLTGNVDYGSYLLSLSASDRAKIVLLDRFTQDNFKNYVNKLNTIVD